MTLKKLEKLGFIYKRLTKHIYLCRLYARRDTVLHYIIIPLWFRSEKIKSHEEESNA